MNQMMKYFEITDISDVLVRGHHGLDNLPPSEDVFFHAVILREIFHMQNILQFHSLLV